MIHKMRLEPSRKLPTGSKAFDRILFGGVPTSAITDIFGAPATGKTQFAFQCSLMTILGRANSPDSSKPLVVFVDCSGSFRPERIIELMRARDLADREREILDSISSIRVRSIAEQVEVSNRILSDKLFSNCQLVVVDDATVNFVSTLGGRDEELIERQYEIASYTRNLAYVAIEKDVAVLLTNSARSRLEKGEVETTGEIISQFALFRLHFKKAEGSKRTATILQPTVKERECEFSIEEEGILP
jgi:DNA repair protein RadA